MTEQPRDRGPDDADPLDDEPATRPDPTGEERVDAVMEAVADLDDRPLEERVAIFEAAHGELRRTLDR